ncbi:3738_t:CDS:1, partial [Cetraspora pellucida]
NENFGYKNCSEGVLNFGKIRYLVSIKMEQMFVQYKDETNLS